MGGFTGYRRPIRTTGDLTGGGGRSVEAVRRRGDPRHRSGLSRLYGPPPGGGYSGGVIPRFQAGGAPRRTGYAPSSYTSPVDPYGRTWGYNRRGRGKSYDPREQIKATQYALQNYWGQPPGGGYSGGVIPRFQQGRALTPRAVKRAWGMNRPHDPNVSRRSMSLAGQARSAAQILAGQIPHFGPESGGSWGSPPPGGWQAGGQFPEPTFPVENQLSDESPWYPDEEVGFEEAAPMQGGFDIFGRSGG